MSYLKEEFKWVSYWHIGIGIWTTLSVFLAQYYANVGQGLNIFALIIGALYVFLGIKIRKANRLFVIAVIILNLFQSINFNLESMVYLFSFGPHLFIDILNWDIYLGTSSNFYIQLGKSFLHQDSYFNLSVINIVIVIYLLDQIRFIPDKIGKPWESEFME